MFKWKVWDVNLAKEVDRFTSWAIASGQADKLEAREDRPFIVVPA